jgi:hypothetical protein
MTSFRKSLRSKRRKAAVFVALLALIPAGAFAYFALHGAAPTVQVDGGSTATTGGTATWAITSAAPVGPALVPGGPGDTVAVTITNTNTVAQSGNDNNLTAQAAGHALMALAYPGFTDIPGCLQAWFSTSISGITGNTVVVPPGGTLNAAEGDSLTVTFSIPADTTNDQSACEGHAIELSLNFSS